MRFEQIREVRWNPALRRKNHPWHRAFVNMTRSYGIGPFRVLEHRVHELDGDGELLAAMGGTAEKLLLPVQNEPVGAWFSAAWLHHWPEEERAVLNLTPPSPGKILWRSTSALRARGTLLPEKNYSAASSTSSIVVIPSIALRIPSCNIVTMPFLTAISCMAYSETFPDKIISSISLFMVKTS